METKRLFLAVLLVIGVFGFSNNAYATSGACSYHGGVNCDAGAADDGSAICNDGTESSVPYSDMDECDDTPTDNCHLPDAEGCTIDAQYESLEQQCESDEKLKEEDPNLITDSCYMASVCKSEIQTYESEMQLAKQCYDNEAEEITSATVKDSQTLAEIQAKNATYASSFSNIGQAAKARAIVNHVNDSPLFDSVTTSTPEKTLTVLPLKKAMTVPKTFWASILSFFAHLF